MRALEGVLAEREVMKREVRTLHEMMEERRHERENAETALLIFQHMHAHESEEPRGGFDMEEDGEREAGDDDDDDVHSISTAVPHELERVEEERGDVKTSHWRVKGKRKTFWTQRRKRESNHEKILG
jgi:hypothetical protein